MNDLSRIDRAAKILAEARTLEDFVEVRDLAEAARSYAKAVLRSLEAMNYAAEIKLRAERRAGELLGNLTEAGDLRDGRPSKRSQAATVSLDDLGVTKSDSSRWQFEATVPEPAFEEFVERVRAEGRELTQAGLIREARNFMPPPPSPKNPVKIAPPSEEESRAWKIEQLLLELAETILSDDDPTLPAVTPEEAAEFVEDVTPEGVTALVTAAKWATQYAAVLKKRR